MKNRCVGLGFVGFLACSSSESGTPAPAPDAGTNTTPTGTPLTVWVYSIADKAGDLPTPLGGAIVAFDPAGGGERVEATTEADGHATVNLDFSKGPAVATFKGPDTIVLTALEVSPETNKNLPANPFGKPNTDLVIALPRNAKANTARSVELAGNFTNKTATDNDVGVSATGVFESYIFPADNFAMRVPKGRPFSIIGFEGPKPDTSVPQTFDRASIRLFRIEHAAVDANGPGDIDVSQGTLAQTTVHWKAELPGGSAGPLAGSACFANIVSFDSGANTGFFKHLAPTADKNAFDIEEVIAQTDLAPEVTRSLVVFQTTDGSVTARQSLGNAPDGTVFKDFLTPPAVAVTKQTRADAFSVEGVPADAEAVNVNLSSGQDLEWQVLGPWKKKPTGPITLPALPTGVSVSSTLKAQIIALADFVEIPGRPGLLVPGKITFSRPITVTK